MNSLNYYKTILRKVSFDRNLFHKEYNKALKELSLEDQLHLKMWCSNHHREHNTDVVMDR